MTSISDKWVIRMPDYREVYQNFFDARKALLDTLWWWSRDIEDADPSLAADVMKAWEVFAESDIVSIGPRRDMFSTRIQGAPYALVRFGMEEEYGFKISS